MKDKDKTTGRAFIIAEIGVNHNGNKNLLRESIKQAVKRCRCLQISDFSAAKVSICVDTQGRVSNINF